MAKPCKQYYLCIFVGTASVARAWSSYFDSLINKKIQHFFLDNMPMNVGGLSPYPDFFAFGITFLLTCMFILLWDSLFSLRKCQLFLIFLSLLLRYLHFIGVYIMRNKKKSTKITTNNNYIMVALYTLIYILYTVYPRITTLFKSATIKSQYPIFKKSCNFYVNFSLTI
jgi:hypothetical protein